MRLSELAILFGIFVLIFYSASTFLTGFQIQQDLPQDIYSAWNETKAEVETAQKNLQQKISEFSSANPLQQLANSISIAFGLVQFLAITAYSTLVTIPSAVFGAINYMADYFGIPSVIVGVVTGLLVVVTVIKMIEFVTGRQGL